MPINLGLRPEVPGSLQKFRSVWPTFSPYLLHKRRSRSGFSGTLTLSKRYPEHRSEQEATRMADVGGGGAASHDVQSLLSSPDRDFLIRNNGDQVKVDSLKGKKIGLYFSASWCGPCQQFTPTLVEVYNELFPRGDLEITFISADKDEKSFGGYFSKMPWLAIPFSDSDKRDSLNKLFKVRGIPHLVIIDGTGTILTDSGVKIVRDYGVEEQEEAARRNQSLTSLLVHESRDFVVSSNGNQVLVTELEGKTVGLYFSLSVDRSCADFTPKLLEVYEKLKDKGESFEIVQIPLDDDEASFNQSFGSMPWFSLPLKDNKCEKLVRYFKLSTLPTLVIIGQDGKTLHFNVAETVEEHGVMTYPFTPEKFAELAEIEKKREESQTLELILVSGDLDFVIGKDGTKIPVSDLVGKTVLLYFSAHWCPPCRAFLPVLTEAYEKIKATDNAFEKFEEKFKESIKGWPEKLKHLLHEEHELVPAQRRMYICDGCNEAGEVWSYYCKECDFDLHPKCAVGEEKATKNKSDEDNEAAGEEAKEGGDAKKDGSVMVRSVIKPESYYIVVLLSMTRLEQFFFFSGWMFPSLICDGLVCENMVCMLTLMICCHNKMFIIGEPCAKQSNRLG
ncbi:hypothetical protein NL676_022529 [Syzygium grande]|nr:hypothetical protein NL676_022529 [Syzygium grande]